MGSVALKSADAKEPAEALAKPKSGEDVALVYGVSDDGQGLDIIRKREGRLEAATVRPLQEGKPIHGEVVRLKPRQHSPMICDVEVTLPAADVPEAEATRSSSAGPAQVATDQYRKNWDAIYKGRASGKKPLLN
jgi:hypothetical protein